MDLKGKKGFAGGIITLVISVILIMSVLLTVVLQQVGAVNRTALGTAGSAIVDILGLGVVVLALVTIFSPVMGKK
jgi:hypothetical protein